MNNFLLYALIAFLLAANFKPSIAYNVINPVTPTAQFENFLFAGEEQYFPTLAAAINLTKTQDYAWSSVSQNVKTITCKSELKYLGKSVYGITQKGNPDSIQLECDRSIENISATLYHESLHIPGYSHTEIYRAQCIYGMAVGANLDEIGKSGCRTFETDVY
jgi:hypothetical protein